MRSFRDSEGRQWTACFECNRGGRGNDIHKCSCGWQKTVADGSGCFSGTPIVGEPRKPEKISRGKARYRKYLEFCDCFESFIDFCRYDDYKKRERKYSY